DELIRPRITITAILSSLPRLPRWTMVSRNDGVGSSSPELPDMRRKAVTANTRFRNRLPHKKTNKKMLKQPSFRLPSMEGANWRRTEARTRGNQREWSSRVLGKIVSH